MRFWLVMIVVWRGVVRCAKFTKGKFDCRSYRGAIYAVHSVVMPEDWLGALPVACLELYFREFRLRFGIVGQSAVGGKDSAR